jgi:hypothetical protein
MQGDLEPQRMNPVNQRDPFMGFGAHRLPVFKDGELAKVVEKQLRKKLYEQWFIDNPI